VTAGQGWAGFQAVVLAGGRGTRLRGRVPDRPAVLAPVAGRPFLGYVLTQLRDAGLRAAVVCTGHGAEAVEAAFGPAWGSLRLTYAREARPLGTGGALRAALPLLAAPDLLVLHGDAFCELDLRALGTHHAAGRADATLVLAQASDAAEYGAVDVDPRGRVRGFRRAAAGPGWVLAGVHCLARRLLGALPEGPASLERELLPGWVGRRLLAWPTRGRLFDIGTEAGYAAAQEYFARAAAPGAA
jgi:NDP-sugar pyrophosphorylase family protein